MDSPDNQILHDSVQMHCPPLVVVGVTGGIAAYKSVILVRLLRKAGVEVHVIPTPAALELVGKTTWEAISGNPVYLHTTDAADTVAHVRYAQNADLLIIAPATANTIAKLRLGIADNLLCNTVLAAQCPILVAPAMHQEMWLNPATTENVSVLKKRGFSFIGPENGRLTGADSGIGRMSEPAAIFSQASEILGLSSGASTNLALPLTGKSIVISGGGTHEPIDPVRFIGNRSTGTMSVALADAFAKLGAAVSLVGANIAENVLDPIKSRIDVGGINYIPVITATELQAEITRLAMTADAIVMAAAVADYRVKEQRTTKIKRDDDLLTLELTANPDILRELVLTRKMRKKQLIIGFAAETGSDEKDFRQLGVEKALRKGADLLAINRVSENSGFGNVETTLFIVDGRGTQKAVVTGNKTEIADQFAKLVSDEILGA